MSTLKARIDEYRINTNMVACAINEKVDIINNLINDKIALTPEISLKLSRFFDTSPDFWFRTEYKYKLHRSRNNKELMDVTLRNITPINEKFQDYNPYKHKEDKEYKPYNLTQSVYNSL
jgi:plasmid maintenance system antidote protein VapI